VLGIKAYPDIAAVPEKVDLAVIVTPAPTVPGVISQCVEAGVPSAIIISAGFKEAGAPGIELEQRVLAEARRGNMRIIGPNCLGVMAPLSGLNATFASAMARPGSVGFLSQSGALCTAVLDWSLQEDVGFSAFVSLGSMLDVDWGDLINYLGDDPRTESILIYMESIGDARSFLSAAREVALTKPIIVIKAGRTEAAARAAASHTGSLAGSDEVLDAAFQRSGVLRVNRIADLFSMAEVLAKQPRPRGPRLMVVTNAGGPGVLATDAIIGDGGELAEPTPQTIQRLNEFLPVHWSHNNPVDILGDAGPDRYAQAVEVAANDPDSDGLLVILTPQAMSDPTQTAERLKPYASGSGRPILASWMGGTDVEAGRAILSRANIPNFRYPDLAAHAFSYMWQYSANLRGLYETPTLPQNSPDDASARATAERIIRLARSEGRELLTEYESKRLLAAYGIPTVETRVATTSQEAVQCADEIGYPVVLKLHSLTITHKTDVGGVLLNLSDADAVRSAFETIEYSVREKASAADFQGVTVQPMAKLEGYEIIIGSSLDAQFGPVLLFGSGGQLVEVYKDRALGLPPLNSTLARRMMEQTKIFTALQGVRGRAPVDIAALEQLLVRFSQLVSEQSWIKEIDINPLLASPERLIALDARVVLHGPDVTEEELPRLAIRPYPSQYVSSWNMRDGTPLTLRPIRPEDEPLMVRFHQTLSQQTVYQRYFHVVDLSRRVEHERLTRRCFNDYDREIALVAEQRDATNAEASIVGIGRLIKTPGTDEAEFAILISDAVQGQGLGTELLRQLVEVGRAESVHRITADILPDNRSMQRIAQKLGFQLQHCAGDECARAEMVL
jgi:acetyltransferase